MIRSSFKRPTIERKRTVHTPIAPENRRGSMAPVAAEVSPIGKFTYVRSKALLVACREIPCQNCGMADGTVVAAHSNQARHGKCKAKKASDQFVASLCHKCHSDLDQGNQMTRAERAGMWDNAHRNTVKTLVKRGLWPLAVPIPDTRSMN